MTAFLLAYAHSPAAGIYVVYQTINIVCLSRFCWIDRTILHCLWGCTMPTSVAIAEFRTHSFTLELTEVSLILTLSAVHFLIYPFFLNTIAPGNAVCRNEDTSCNCTEKYVQSRQLEYLNEKTEA
ncbi:hypothetical protein Moror_4715 [Moniliophthora roreri MCA 2997]|uniref:Uncharacterized protein n=1 Tax=Moniliophthora roreri (strain MCA 2997) TaxID=1381753 RepID=V2WZB7_MONRO|nr:hypothetical protein Moror_4715 [Moniliophthora roreri MCA 2997]